MAKEQKLKDDLQLQLPGEEVVLVINGKDVTFRVYPVGVADMYRFSKAITKAVQSITMVDFPSGLDGKVKLDFNTGKMIAGALLDVVMSDMLDLVVNSIRPRPMAAADVKIQEGSEKAAIFVPHWSFPPLLEAWLNQNFGSEDKIRPWVQAIENIISKTTGRSIEIWSTLSRYLSPAAIRNVMSSKRDTGDSTDKNSPSGDGQSGNSGEQSSPVNEKKTEG